MLRKIDDLLMEANSRLNSFVEEEKGASDMVAVIVLIVVVIAVAGIFREQLGNAVEAVFNKLQDFVK